MQKAYRISDRAVQRLQNALDYIMDHPEEWDQGCWVAFVDENTKVPEVLKSRETACGTVACLAGRIGIQAGAPFRETTLFNGDTVVWAEMVVVDGISMNVSTYVLNLLMEDIVYFHPEGLNYFTDDYFCMTSGLNSLENLWFYAQELADDRLVVPENVYPDAYVSEAW